MLFFFSASSSIFSVYSQQQNGCSSGTVTGGSGGTVTGGSRGTVRTGNITGGQVTCGLATAPCYGTCTYNNYYNAPIRGFPTGGGAVGAEDGTP